MRIAIDCTSWANGRGYGRFVRELVPPLCRIGASHEFLLLVEEENAARLEGLGDRARIVPVRLSEVPTRAAAADSSRSLGDMWRLRRAVSRARPDLLFYPTVYTWFPPPFRMRSVVTIHDAIAERFPELCFGNARARLFWNLKVKGAIRLSDRVVTVSEHARRDLERVLGIPGEKLSVAVEAPGKAFRRIEDETRSRELWGRLGLPHGVRPFVYVGGFNPHKRLDLVIRALAALGPGEAVASTPLVLVGALDGDAFHGSIGEIRTLVDTLGIADRLRWPGFLPDADLALLHSGALALLLPSMCEGFGLPAVEAAACGAAVIATSESPLPDLLRDAGHFVPPGDLAALTAAMQRLVDHPDEARALGARGLERCGALSWDEAAGQVLRTIEEAAR